MKYITEIKLPEKGSSLDYRFGIGKIMIIKDKYNYTKKLRVTKSPFFNCQMGTIGGAYELLETDNPLGIVLEVFKQINKPLLMVDIQSHYLKDFKKIFRKGIISTKRYISSNKSVMYIIIIQNKWS